MSGWGTGARRPLSFVPPPPPAAPPALDDDDVWGEELPEEALEEAMLLESQQLAQTPAAVRQPPPAPHTQMRPPAAAPRQPTQSQAPLSELQLLRRDNQALSEQLRNAKADKYSQQGQVSVLREELTRRCRELENCRLESSRQLQEQQSLLEQSTGALNKELDALRTELQFKNHELSEVTRQWRSARDSPGHAGSPPRKAPRLDSTDTTSATQQRRNFITSADFRRAERSAVQTGTSATQTDLDPRQSDADADPEDDELPVHELVLAVLRADGAADGAALSALADRDPTRAGRAADRLAAAAADRLRQFTASAEKLQTAAAAADRRPHTLGSGRRRAAARAALQAEETAALAALTTLRRLAEWSAELAARLTANRDVADLLPKLLRPAIAQGEVTNIRMMEQTATLLATMASDSLPEHLVVSLGPVLHEVFNTKPPARLLLALLELLVSAAGTGQITGLWCRGQPSQQQVAGQKHSGTCLVKKLSILFSERSRPSEPPSASSYRLPASHSRRGLAGRLNAHPGAADASGTPEITQQTQAPSQPAGKPLASCDGGGGGAPDGRWLQLVGLVVWRPAALPSQSCCRGNLTLLVVQLLHASVRHWQHTGGSGDTSAALHLLSALHRLADLDPDFSLSVSRERLRYLATMETLGRCWKPMRLTAQHVGVLQELYKFSPGTFDAAALEQSRCS